MCSGALNQKKIKTCKPCLIHPNHIMHHTSGLGCSKHWVSVGIPIGVCSPTRGQIGRGPSTAMRFYGSSFVAALPRGKQMTGVVLHAMMSKNQVIAVSLGGHPPMQQSKTALATFHATKKNCNAVFCKKCKKNGENNMLHCSFWKTAMQFFFVA